MCSNRLQAYVTVFYFFQELQDDNEKLTSARKKTEAQLADQQLKLAAIAADITELQGKNDVMRQVSAHFVA